MGKPYAECHASNPKGDGYISGDEACVECFAKYPKYAAECKRIVDESKKKEVKKMEPTTTSPEEKKSHKFRPGTARGTVYEMLQAGKPEGEIIHRLETDFRLSKNRARSKISAVKKLS